MSIFTVKIERCFLYIKYCKFIMFNDSNVNVYPMFLKLQEPLEILVLYILLRGIKNTMYSNNGFVEELMANRFHPSNIDK